MTAPKLSPAMQPQPMETAPKDREILIFAQWDWDDMAGEETDTAFAWRVAEWMDGRWKREGFWSVSDNPYSDRAIRPRVWCELPDAGLAALEGEG